MSASPRLPFPYRPEAAIVASYLQSLAGALDWADAAQSAQPWVQAVRDNPPPFWAMIIITHRTSLLDLADRLIVMDAGRIVADGPKDQVVTALKQGRIGKAV